MIFVQLEGFIEEDTIRRHDVARMLAQSYRPIMKNFIDWITYGDRVTNSTLENYIPLYSNFFDWMEQKYNINTCFISHSGKNLFELFETLTNHHKFDIWTGCYIRLNGHNIPAMLFSSPVDVVVFRLYYDVYFENKGMV